MNRQCKQLSDHYIAQYQSISEYDPESGKRYIELVRSSQYQQSTNQSTPSFLLADLSRKQKERILKRIGLFSIMSSGHCAVCLNSISQNAHYRLIASEIYCSTSCSYMGKAIIKELRKLQHNQEHND